ncbi:cytochrome b558/566 subunit B [Acidianus sulfidivorans JP7]|uniref:Cytochrome b558/566 subunit B n=1 Tax=Acidianus sulfidivorans JP7 TaxID=619593 RepID=A0A2U9IPL4_9CREN|nr:cytochrome b558/566 subunit B [Acidianus sulfidivorans]AWR97952.1 cytochrome b558/566 subunit B [Acidianus sulfidivorans JP7]
MSMIESIHKDIKIYSIFLAFSAFLEFLFEFIFPISYLPLSNVLSFSLTSKLIVEYLGTAGLYLEYIALSIVAIGLSNKVKALLPLGIFLLISPFLNLAINSLSPFWDIFEVAIMTLGIFALVESFIKSNLSSILSIPTMILIIANIYAGYLIDFEHYTLNLSFTYLFLASVIGFGIYSIIWGKIISKRSIIAYISGIFGAMTFLPLYFLVTSNRFMEIIMDMTIPAIFGIVFHNPYSLGLFLLLVSIALYFIVAISVKGNGYAGLGYFLILTTGFMGITGFHLIIYMAAPIIGYALLNFKDGKGQKILNLKKYQSNNKSL